MPTLSFKETATADDVLSGKKFKVIPQRGAIINLWAAGAAAGNKVGLAIGDREIVPTGSDVNIEISADVVDVDRDQILFDEPVGPGELFMPATVATELNVLLNIRYI